MNHLHLRLIPGLFLLGAAALCMARPVSAEELITNGGFESNGGIDTASFSGWTVVDDPIGSGSTYVQTGTSSPGFGFTVAAPPEGTFAAMTAQQGPGAHVLYQDFVVPVGVTSASLSFERFVLNLNGDFFSPDSLDVLGGFANQQARVDILTVSSDPFSVASGDVLLNLFQTQPGDPATSGYSTESSDVTGLLAAHGGETLRLRFAEADNQFYFNFGVDSVSLDVTSPAVPEPGNVALLISMIGTGAAFACKRRRQ